MQKSAQTADLYAGSKLKLQRQIRGMSQGKVAEALGITFQQIQKYEKGKNRISASRLQMIASLLGVPVSFFFEGNEGNDPYRHPDASGEAMSTFLTANDGMNLNRYFVKIEDATVRSAIVDLVEALSQMDAENGF